MATRIAKLEAQIQPRFVQIAAFDRVLPLSKAPMRLPHLGVFARKRTEDLLMTRA
jgi:hypothetical protein